MSTSDSTSPSTPLDSSDHNLQPFFVLGKASPLKPELKETRPQKTRRKIEVSHEKVVDSKPEVFDSKNHEELRLRAFYWTWSKIERTIEDVLRQINLSLFDGVLAWIFECFMGIKSMREEFQEDVTRAYPLVTDAICKQIPAAFILTRNMEFVDDLPTFQELGVYLRSNGCHVGILSSLDFTANQGVGGCLRSLLRQLLVVDSDTVHISALASWYNELKDHDKPIVVIIDDAEQCNGSVLAEFITMLSEWLIKIPAILVLGVATTVDALRKLLPSDALQHLQPYQFTSESPQERMNSIIEAILIKPCSGFVISHKVALLLKNYFLRHDGTITAFVKALKIACSEHFFIEPLSFLSYYLFDEECKVFLDEKCKSLPSKLLDHAFYFPSCEGETVNEQTADKLLQGMLEIKKSRQCWSIVLMCLVEVGKLNKVQLLDIFCEAADPALYKHRASGHYLKFPTTTPSSLHDKKLSGLAKGGFIIRAIHRIRDLPLATLLHILKVWESQTKEICEVHDKVRDLQSLLKATAADMNLKRQPDNMCKSTSRASSAGKETAKVNEKAALLMEAMIRLFRYSRRRPSLTLIFICFLLAFTVRDCAAKCDPRKILSNDKTKNNERRHGSNTLVGKDQIGYGCTKDDIVVYQSPTAPLPTGMPAYDVHILNECMWSDCELSDIHLSCEWFASTELINPRVFRRIDYDDCLVNDGKPLTPGGLLFKYTNSFSYPLSVSHAACN